MFTASFFFLGLAVFVLAASVCLAWAKPVDNYVEMDRAILYATSVCLNPEGRSTANGTTAKMYKEPTRDDEETRWFSECQEMEIAEQRALYSWVRTLALCAVLCLMGVLLEAEFDQPITLHTILTGFRRADPVASAFQASPFAPPQNTSASAA